MVQILARHHWQGGEQWIVPLAASQQSRFRLPRLEDGCSLWRLWNAAVPGLSAAQSLAPDRARATLRYLTRLLRTSPFTRLYSSHLQCAGVVGQLSSSASEALYRSFRKCHNSHRHLISHYSCWDLNRSMASVTTSSCSCHVQKCSYIPFN